MFPNTSLSKLLGIDYPVIQAPMGGGATTPDLIAAVCNSGGLGSLGAAYLSPDTIRQSVGAIRTRTKKPFNVNLFVLESPNPNPEQVARALELLQPFRIELGLPAATLPSQYCENFQAQFDALLEMRPYVASFTFGILTKAQAAALKTRGILLIGTATTVAEAQAWEAAGADAICAQGSEAGAHRGTFLGKFEDAMIGTIALVPQIVDAVHAPVIAAGGIMDGRGIAASLMLGASGAQLGTAFLTCPECGIPAPWKALLFEARDDNTRVTRTFSGRPARGLINDFMVRMGPVEHELPPYPVQNALTAPIRQAAAKANRPEFLSLWAGQAARMSRGLPAAELVLKLVDETRTTLARGSAESSESAR